VLNKTFSKISSLYYYLNFEEIVIQVSEILPEFWAKNPELHFLMVKFHLFELVKSNKSEEAYNVYYCSVIPIINKMETNLREKKNFVFNNLINRVDLMRSNFYINKAEFYFQLFLEKLKLEATNYYLGMENFYYKVKLKEIDIKLSSIEDIEDGLYLNAMDLAMNFPGQSELTNGN